MIVEMGKLGIFGLALLMLLTARCYGADYEAALSGLPVVGPMISPPAPVPTYVNAIGTPVAATLPESDMKSWFAPPADPQALPDIDTWRAIGAAAGTSGTKDGWAAVCKKASETTGEDRAAEPLLGALACSGNGTVTALQRFAVGILAMQAETALYWRGVPGASVAAIQSRQGELRLACAVDVVARQGGAAGVFAAACASVLETAYLAGDAPATYAALTAAYGTVAAEIARLDPKTAAEPSYFEPVQK
jgi:hypothetical protein